MVYKQQIISTVVDIGIYEVEGAEFIINNFYYCRLHLQILYSIAYKYAIISTVVGELMARRVEGLEVIKNIYYCRFADIIAN